LVFPNAHETFRDSLKVSAGLAAVLGHNFTCWLHFKGGKGIATSAGMLIALVWPSLLIILSVWIVVFVLTRYVSLASICAAITLPFSAWLTHETTAMIGITALVSVLAIYKHKANIQRLLNAPRAVSASKNLPPQPRRTHPHEETVLGAGAWGTALAVLLQKAGMPSLSGA